MNLTPVKYKARLLIALWGLSLLSPSLITAQEIQTRTLDLRGIPDNLRSSLLERIRQFVEAQRNGEWDQVSALLGEFRDNSYRPRYTPEHKQCLIEQMKSSPMMSFVPLSVGFSSEILSKPLSRKWWFIKGDVEFRPATGNAKGQTTITAYRYNGQWFLTPPNYDQTSERANPGANDSASLNQYLKAEVAPDCPVEVTDLSIQVHPEYHSLRQVSFSIRNKSRKTVDGLAFRIEKIDRQGSSLTGGALIIPPGETVRERTTYSAYVYYCEGESYNRLVISWVRFTDGSEWNLNRRGVNRRQRR